MTTSNETSERAADSASKAAELIEPSLEALGYRLVRARLHGGHGRRTLEILAERHDGSMTVDDCAAVSEAVSAILDVADPISGEYLLEVSSPGLDRPLTRLDDYRRFRGFVAKIHLRRSVDGRRRFKARLDGVADGKILLASEAGAAPLDFEDIESAHLVITDDLLAARPS